MNPVFGIGISNGERTGQEFQTAGAAVQNCRSREKVTFLSLYPQWVIVQCAGMLKSRDLCGVIPAALPDITIHDVTPDHEFVVLACDGIWDVLSSQEVVDFVRVRIAQQMEPEIVSEKLCCVYPLPAVYVRALYVANIIVNLCKLEICDFWTIKGIFMYM